MHDFRDLFYRQSPIAPAPACNYPSENETKIKIGDSAIITMKKKTKFCLLTLGERRRFPLALIRAQQIQYVSC